MEPPVPGLPGCPTLTSTEQEEPDRRTSTGSISPGWISGGAWARIPAPFVVTPRPGFMHAEDLFELLFLTGLPITLLGLAWLLFTACRSR